jgi:hypothetical protein
MSRVFQPHVELDLAGEWLRRDDTAPNAIKLSAGISDRRLAIVRLDFVQCGSAAVLDHPNASAAAAAIAASRKLSASAPRAMTLGDRTGLVIDLPGKGAGAGDAIDPANGCIFTAGPAPFPAEALWIVLASDSKAHLVLIDVGSQLVLVSARSQTTSPAALAELADPVIRTIRFPGGPPGN